MGSIGNNLSVAQDFAPEKRNRARDIKYLCARCAVRREQRNSRTGFFD